MFSVCFALRGRYCFSKTYEATGADENPVSVNPLASSRTHREAGSEFSLNNRCWEESILTASTRNSSYVCVKV